MNKTNPNDRGSPLKLVLPLVFAGGFFWLLLSLFDSKNPNPSAKITGVDFSYILLWIGIQILEALAAFGIFVFLTKKFKKSVLMFLNARWLPTTMSYREYISLPREKKEKETAIWYDPLPGEKHQVTAYPNWWASTFLVSYKPIVSSFFFGFIIGLVQVFVIESVLIKLILGIFIPLFVLGLNWYPYYKTEYKRTNHFYILTSDNLVDAQASDGGIFGLITGKVGDIKVKRTPFYMIREPDSATDPRRFTGKMTSEDLLNKFYDLLGSTRKGGLLGNLAQGLLTLYYPSRDERASDMLLSLSHGGAFDRILMRLKTQSIAKQELIGEVTHQANRAWVDSQDENWSKEKADEVLQEVISTRLAHFAKTEPINWWNLRNDPGIWNLETGELVGNQNLQPQARSARSHFES